MAFTPGEGSPQTLMTPMTRSTDTMRGLWLENGEIVLRDDLPRPQPAAGEALIRTRLAGICGTDVQLLRGYYDYVGVPGHEFVGEVVEAGPQSALNGRRVVGSINIGCGSCDFCARGDPRHCSRRRVLGIHSHPGVFAEYFTLPLENLQVVPDGVDDQDAVFTEPLAAALHITEQVVIERDTRVLIVGAGKLGQLIAMVMALHTDRLAVVVRHPGQHGLLEAQGIEVLDTSGLGTRQWDVVIESSGSPSGMGTALAHIKPTGTVVIKSTYKDDVALPLSRVVVDEITLVGSRCGPFAPALELLRHEQVAPHRLIAHTYPLSDADQAFEAALQPGAGKVLLSF